MDIQSEGIAHKTVLDIVQYITPIISIQNSKVNIQKLIPNWVILVMKKLLSYVLNGFTKFTGTTVPKVWTLIILGTARNRKT